MKSVAATMLMLVFVVALGATQEDSQRATPAVREIESGPLLLDENHYSLDASGGRAVSSAELPTYLAELQERAAAWAFLLTFPDLLFAAGSTQIDTLVQGELARMADFLRAHPDTTARITGHTDDRGGTVSNMLLAEQRAATVRSYLIDRGIDADRLVISSQGEASPRRDNRSADGRDGNRRVQISVHQPVR